MQQSLIPSSAKLPVSLTSKKAAEAADDL